MQNPCRPNCDRRDGYCHSTCLDYIRYQRWNEQIRETIRREKEANTVLYGRKPGLKIANYRKSYEKL